MTREKTALIFRLRATFSRRDDLRYLPKSVRSRRASGLRSTDSYPQFISLLPQTPSSRGAPAPRTAALRLSSAKGSAQGDSPREDSLEQGGCDMTESTLYKGNFCLDDPDHLTNIANGFDSGGGRSTGSNSGGGQMSALGNGRLVGSGPSRGSSIPGKISVAGWQLSSFCRPH